MEPAVMWTIITIIAVLCGVACAVTFLYAFGVYLMDQIDDDG